MACLSASEFGKYLKDQALESTILSEQPLLYTTLLREMPARSGLVGKMGCADTGCRRPALPLRGRSEARC
jgi:hypothetical protein